MRLVGRISAAAGAVMYLALATALVWLAFAAAGADEGPGVAGKGWSDLVVLLPPTTFVAVGVVLMSRVPRNAAGWTLCGYGLNFAATVVSESYVVRSQASSSPLEFVEVAAWFQTWNWALGLILLTLLLLHFPTGELPSSRWRGLRGAAVLLAIAVMVAWIDVWSVRFDPSLVHNTSAYPGLASAVQTVAEPGPMLLVLLGCVSLFVRYRRADFLERLQLRWLFFAVAVAVTGLMVFLLTGSGPGREAPLAAEVLTLLGLAAIPVAIGVAVLRYRLYDLDRIVSRTFTYALLTGVLVGVYALGVIGVGALLPGERSDLLVAASTLAVAALFRPLRSRIQGVVDRRFNRARYDAARTVSTFANRLRDQVDLPLLAEDLRGVTIATFQPRQASLWLPGGEG